MISPWRLIAAMVCAFFALIVMIVMLHTLNGEVEISIAQRVGVTLRGGLILVWWDDWVPADMPSFSWKERRGYVPWLWCGPSTFELGYWELCVPLWGVLLGLFVLVAILQPPRLRERWAVRRAQRERERVERDLARGVCPHCGYSRAGLAPGAACPECGTSATG